MLTEYVPNQIWLKEYPIRFKGTRFNSRMTVIRLPDSRLILHSPCPMDTETKASLEALGPVAFIVAPGNFHHLHIESAQAAFPQAETFICPGLERKRPELKFDWILGDRVDPRWQGTIAQRLVRGTRIIWEVAFLHIPSRTLILVDLIENFTDQTPGVNWLLRFWFKAIFRMWNRPKAAPEYQLGWGGRKVAGKSLEGILEWDFSRVVLAHGDLIEHDAKAILREAWKTPLAHA
jgi:hypothetical protein